MSNNYNNPFEDENFLFLPNKKNSFALPDGYFDSLADRIIHKVEIESELQHFSVLSKIGKTNLFTTPKNYFEATTNKLELESELSEFELLSKIAKPNLKPISGEYFEGVAQNVILKQEIVEETKGFNTLSAIEKENNFVVHPEYFDSLADTIKEKIHSTNRAKVSVFESIFATIFKPRVAFAYSLIIAISVSMIWYFNKPETITKNGDCKTLACLEKNEILNEQTARDFDEDNLYEMVDIDVLDKQLSESDVETKNDSVKK